MATNIVSLTATESFSFVQPNGFSLAAANLTKTRGTETVFTAGTSVDQLQVLHFKTYTIAASSTMTIDLNDPTAIFNPNNEALTMVRVKFMRVELPDGGSQSASVLVDGGASNVMTNWRTTVYKGTGAQVRNPTATGWAITNSTGDKLVIVNNDGANTATVVVTAAGCTA